MYRRGTESMRSTKFELNVDVDDIIKKSIKRDRALVTETSGGSDKLDEAYVAEPKPFKQVSELVSQKTKDAHVALYKGYVDALNRTSAELDSSDREGADSKHSQFKSLKQDESHNLNGVWLHELYFANSFDPHSEVYMDSKSYMKLQEAFGTFDDWQKDMIACAQAAGEGWAICGYNMFLKKYVNTIVCGHDVHAMLGLYPLIVIDLHEHAYWRDYLSDKKSYIISRMRELNWNVIEERFNRAESIATVLK